MASSSSSATSQVSKKYDVFISFRGEETRTTITDILHGRLRWEYNINVFMDDQLHKGDEISPSLMNTIEDSKISVIIFSESYASSRWCLEELVKIMEYKKAYRQIVIRVFFCVDPSHVRNQTDTFGDGFARLVEICNKEKLEKLQMTEEQFQEKVQAWRNAVTKAANLCGYTATPTTSLYGITKKIVGDILEMLNYLSSEVDNNNLIAIEPSIGYIIKYLLGLDNYQLMARYDNHRIGIWGMGGVGKTTIAEAVYNKIWPMFEASYFALNVREKSSNQNTLTLLRQELLSTLINDWHSNMTFTYHAKRRLGSQKVLIIFDDVTCFSQIEFLIGDLNCLGRGSYIIITKRNKQVLRNYGVHERYIYKIEGLSHCGALQLFSRHAFGQNHPQKGYGALSDRVVEYAKGIPLALKVLGCFLLDKSKEVWVSAISKLEIIPHEDIQKVLKVSYDRLDDTEKNIFLDIVCFLKWENKDFATEFLDACGFYAKLGISVLIDICLVTISNDNKIMIHDLLQEMGWEIVRQESTKDPDERSRLWYHEDINSVLEENTGTKAIEGICLDMSKQKEIIYLQPGALSLMRKLRFFKLHNPQYEENNINKVHVSEDLNSISTELRYLCWQGCPLKSLQSNFRPRNLIALDMPHSNIEQLLPGHQLHKLKHIDLSYSKNLRIQDLSLAPNLESLILKGCTNLFKISSSIHLESLKKAILSCCSKFKMFDPEISSNIEELFLDETAIEELPTSIENLSKLVRLNLKNCTMLENLPSNIYKLKSLEHLILSGCSKLDGLPDNIGNLEALKVLQAERIGKMLVPSSIVHLRCLMELNLTNCCIKELPNDLGQLSSLETLLLGRNFFESIPTSIVNLSKLSYLDLSFCEC
ncbi:disease resistance-like protein DSC1 [Pistacia vera]|uniref:disease resistance-like protein DSC1 n=1 Tax=Pistacia vera TaxID=55513 RepID=UPI001263BAE1|nr:disease resistance-like protein DSC1 [Pistacia vera]